MAPCIMALGLLDMDTIKGHFKMALYFGGPLFWWPLPRFKLKFFWVALYFGWPFILVALYFVGPFLYLS